MSGCHLFVLIHGLHGSVHDMEYMKSRLMENIHRESECDAHANGVVVLISKCNSGWFCTRDGVDSGGERVCNEACEFVKCHKCLTHISFIGHSLGGMYARYACARVTACMNNNTVRQLVMVNLVCFASPNVGIVQRRTGWNRSLDYWGTGVLGGKTGKQLNLFDVDESSEELPLIVRMCQGEFLEALSSFEKRIVIANIHGDVSVPFCTATILPANFYRSLNQSEIPCIPDHSHIVDRARVLALPYSNSGGSLGDLTSLEPLPPTFCAETNDSKWLKTMLIGLNGLEWERIDCLSRFLLSHTDIVVKRQWLNN
eukprot:501369_1